MNRKMTLFAFAGKCGFFAPDEPSADVASFASIEASAIDPTPIGHRLKKCRRVSVFNRSASATASLPGDGFVQVQQHASRRQLRQAFQYLDLIARRLARCAATERRFHS